MDIPFGFMNLNKRLRFNREDKHELVTDVGVFQNCSLKRVDTNYTILDSSKAERGCIQYDVEASEDLQAERCVVVGREVRRWDKKYYILVVRPTGVDGKYMRVGVGWVHIDYVVRRWLDVRVV